MARDTRPLLIGMNNPLSTRPRYALWPDPPGCSGHRLWSLLNDAYEVTREEYVAAFDRVNLVVGPWDATVARREVDLLVASGALECRTAVLLGRSVQDAFGWRRRESLDSEVCSMTTGHGAAYSTTLVALPHPSGMCRWYNDPENRRRAGVVLADLFAQSVAAREEAA